MSLFLFGLAAELLSESEVEQSGQCHPAERRHQHPGKALPCKKLVLKHHPFILRAVHLLGLEQPGPALRLSIWGDGERQTFRSGGWRGDDIHIVGELRFVLRSGLPNPPDRERPAGFSGHGHHHIGREVLLLERRQYERNQSAKGTAKPTGNTKSRSGKNVPRRRKLSGLGTTSSPTECPQAASESPRLCQL